MKVGFLITARLKSSRLKKKLLLPFGNENYITQLVRRLKTSAYLDEIVICTSVDEEDTPLEAVAVNENIHCYRGDREDVISRLNEARIKYGLDYVINMTADCPLVPVELIPGMISQFKQTHADLIHIFNMPIGLYLSGLNPTAMQTIVDKKNDGLTEYWLYYFLKTNQFNVQHLEEQYTGAIEKKHYRIALDYPEDHDFFTALHKAYGDALFTATAKDIISFLDAHPEIVNINLHCTELGKQRTDEDPAAKVSLKNT
jgi:spore coat polysaccharide biosynthesis protein SpsF